MSLDHRFQSDKEWFISPVIDLSEFLQTASTSLLALRETSGVLASSEYDVPIKDEEGQALDENAEVWY